ncbi:MAG TPA: expansin EXLX1 family cellulose-binding protein [Anaerolineales bacterium]|nr:expansin EXLX1 family cellulose-binding protein [Anaerolineales bacterium]
MTPLRILLALVPLWASPSLVQLARPDPISPPVLQGPSIDLGQPSPAENASEVTSTIVYLPIVQNSASEAFHAGEGTYYDATGAGNCSFDPSPQDLMVAAMNQTDYDHAALCGAYVEVSGPKGTVTVRIVDRCPECAPGDVDLSKEAFALIADLVAGRVPIRWRIVSPELQGPIVYRFKEGSNPYWTAVQIRNHRNPVARFEYLVPGGPFKSIPRTDYNYFVEDQGMGAGPYTFRVIDIYGHVLQDSGIPFIEGGEIPGSAQFPPP